MSESSKPTRGPWWVDVHKNIMASGGLVAFPGVAAGFDQQANAHLIAVAGTVFHETGLTPRGLVEQIDQLREALKLLDDAYCNVSPVMSREDRASGRRALIKARTALANTERKTSSQPT